MGRVGFRGRTRRYAFLLVRERSGAGVDGAAPAGDRHASFLADFLGNCAFAFPICPLMRQKCAFRYFGPDLLEVVIDAVLPIMVDRFAEPGAGFVRV